VADRVTIHHLLTHTSGLGRYFNPRFEAARSKLRAVMDYIPLFVEDPLAFEPGAGWRYSDAGFILLGAAIESITRQTYFEYVRNHVYQPAGMINTDAYEMDRPVPNRAIGYTFNGLDDRPNDGPRRNNLFMHVVKGSPAGGAFSTVEDLSRFSQALLGHHLLNPELTDLVLAGKVTLGEATLGTPEEKRYAYGFMVTLVEGKRIAGHSGTFPGVGARLDMYLDHGYTVVILSNYDPFITQAIGNRLREWIAGY
jgi:CubicO group peptidase (beta-lactamase class C family)